MSKIQLDGMEVEITCTELIIRFLESGREYRFKKKVTIFLPNEGLTMLCVP